MNTLTSIQILRAVAAWLVVYEHYLQLPFHSRDSSKLEQFISPHGYFGVDIFFVISGFIMFYSLANKSYGAKEFFVKRLQRIMPAYWFYTLLMAFLCWVYTDVFWFTGWDLKTLIMSLVFIPSNNISGIGAYPLLTVGWTLIFEMFFYALLSVCIFAFGRFRFLVCAAVLIVLPLTWNDSWVHSLSPALPIRSLAEANYSIELLYEFVIGIVLGYGYLRLKNTRPYLLYMLGIAMFVGGTQIGPGSGALIPLPTYLLVGSALCFESPLSKMKFNSLRLFRYLGDISYSTYLLHTIVITVFTYYTGIPDSISGELLLLLLLSLTIVAISHLSYRYLETGPLLTLMKKTA